MISPEIQFIKIYVVKQKNMKTHIVLRKGKVRKMKKVIIEGNAVYEVDEECLKRMEEKKDKEKKEEEKEKGCK